MVKLISAIMIGFIGYLGWQNITEVQKQNELKRVQFLKPAQQYLTAFINSVNEGPIDLQFSNFKTKSIIPGRQVQGSFQISYIQNETYTDSEQANNITEEVSLKTRAHFTADIMMTSLDGEYWTTKIVKVTNTAQHFADPMYINVKVD